VRAREREVCLCSDRVVLRVRVEDLGFCVGVSLGFGEKGRGDSR
jgi:hypothetical protein